MPPSSLGYLDPEHLRRRPPQAAARARREAIEREVARPLGLTVEQAALGIHRIVNAQMAEGIRFVSIRQGHDPRRFTLLPLGGGGAAACLRAGRGARHRPHPRPAPPGRAVGGRPAGRARRARGLCSLPRAARRARCSPRSAQRSTSWTSAADGADGAGERRRPRDIARSATSPTSATSARPIISEVPFEPGTRDPLAALHDRISTRPTIASTATRRRSPVRLVNLRTVHSVAGARWTRLTRAGSRLADHRSSARRASCCRRAAIAVEATVYDRAALKAGDDVRRPCHRRAGRHHHAASRPAGTAGSMPPAT